MASAAWLTAPRAGRGIWLADQGGRWERITYAELASAARRVAADLDARGVRQGDVVAVAMPAGRDCLAALFGAWAAGACLCMLPAANYGSGQEYAAHAAAILRQARPAVTFADDDSAALLGELAPVSRVRYAAAEAPVRQRAATAAVQFTSGSTGRPRGLKLTWDNIAANMKVLDRWTGWREGDAGASWLPLNHDMGFVGGLLLTVAHQGDLWLMRPDQFIRDPARWLSCLGPGRANHTAAPPFGYGHAARRVGRERWAGLDLSGWRTAIVGAQAIDRGVLRAFARAARPAGFDPAALMPAYGLAENTVAVTAGGPAAGPAGRAGKTTRVVRPDWRRMRFGEPVTVLETGVLVPDEPDTDAGGAGWLTGHGLPSRADGVGVRIEDSGGTPLPGGTLGEIVVTGGSVADGYLGEPPLGGVLRTGDAGFVLDGDLYVLGRMGDSLKVRARSVYVEDLDAKASAAAGLDRLAVIGVTDGGQPCVAVFAEARPGPWAGRVREALRAELGPEPAITVIAGPRGLIRRTPSGKPRRREMWRLWSSGSLRGTPVA
jgi:fatty-acyl-CoA synthase